MTFTWTIPDGAPVYQTQDPYSLDVVTLLVEKEGTYTVFLENHIEYGDQVWDETVSYVITVVNPCVDTEIYLNDTIVDDMEYTLEELTKTQKIYAVTDTISNSVTTSGDCGNFIYTFANTEASVGTGFIKLVDLLEGEKGLRVYAEDEDLLGIWEITMNVYMEEYSSKTGSLTFNITILTPEEAVSADIYYPPVLDTDVS